MAIFDGPQGLVPACECKKYAKYPVASDASEKIYKGTPIMITSGYAVPYHEDSSPTDIVGVAIHHVEAAPGADAYVTVTDDPDMEFDVLCDATFAIGDGAYMGLVAHGTANGANAGSNDHSTAVLDEDTQAAAATAVAPFRILGLSPIPGNSATLAAGKTPVLRVKIEKLSYFTDTDT